MVIKPRTDLSNLAAASLLAAVLAAVIQIVDPFDHGTWLLAYLFLVGVVSSYLLGRGQAVLLFAGRQPAAPRNARQAQLVLWAMGVIAVPFGVLADARLGVVLGSLSLLVALVSFWASVRPVLGPPGVVLDRRARGYISLLVFLAASTIVGTALAWDIRWV